MTVAPVGAAPFVAPTLSSGSVNAPHDGAFAEGLAQVQQLTANADATATGVATGQVDDIQTFTTAAAKASLGVDLTVALRNRAVEAYQEIMRMQV
jgi:flagellar hook-basal body complex protein FliE